MLKDHDAFIFRVKQSKKNTNEHFYNNVMLSHSDRLSSVTCNTWLNTFLTFHSLAVRSPSQAEAVFSFIWGCKGGGVGVISGWKQ
jgi:hypothetical protein